MSLDDARRELWDAVHLRLLALQAIGADVDPFDGIGNVGHVIAQLAQEDDDRLSAQTAIDVMGALWPDCSPEDVGQADWWRSALGALCARSFGTVDAASVSHSVAAAMLGVHRSQIGALVSRGSLDRHPDGGVLRASVLQRIAGMQRSAPVVPAELEPNATDAASAEDRIARLERIVERLRAELLDHDADTALRRALDP